MQCCWKSLTSFHLGWIALCQVMILALGCGKSLHHQSWDQTDNRLISISHAGLVSAEHGGFSSPGSWHLRAVWVGCGNSVGRTERTSGPGVAYWASRFAISSEMMFVGKSSGGGGGSHSDTPRCVLVPRIPQFPLTQLAGLTASQHRPTIPGFHAIKGMLNGVRSSLLGA